MFYESSESMLHNVYIESYIIITCSSMIFIIISRSSLEYRLEKESE